MIPVSNPVTKHGINFDSTWECRVYEFLLTWFLPEDIRCHVDVLLYPKTNVVPGLSINIDFYIISQELWIEAKGDLGSVINDAFKVKYHILHRVFPHCFNRLIVVDQKGGRKLPGKAKTTLSLHDLFKLFRNIGLTPL